MFPKPIVVIMMCVKSNHYVGHFRFTVLYVSYISIKWKGRRGKGNKIAMNFRQYFPKYKHQIR